MLTPLKATRLHTTGGCWIVQEYEKGEGDSKSNQDDLLRINRNSKEWSKSGSAVLKSDAESRLTAAFGGGEANLEQGKGGTCMGCVERGNKETATRWNPLIFPQLKEVIQCIKMDPWNFKGWNSHNKDCRECYFLGLEQKRTGICYMILHPSPRLYTCCYASTIFQ